MKPVSSLGSASAMEVLAAIVVSTHMSHFASLSHLNMYDLPVNEMAILQGFPLLHSTNQHVHPRLAWAKRAAQLLLVFAHLFSEFGQV